MTAGQTASLIAVDIGNSRLKIGRFEPQEIAPSELPEPAATFDLAISNATGKFDTDQIHAWCNTHVSKPIGWVVASVHRAAGERLARVVDRLGVACPIRHLTYLDVPLEIRVDEPHRVGIDRLLGALAAERLRARHAAAIVVDLGTATTIDLLDVDAAFAGGAILPGIGMSARALAEQTDALPLVDPASSTIPAPLGKSTDAAIRAGLYRGAVGAIREVTTQLAGSLTAPPELFLTGGAAPRIAEFLSASSGWSVRHVPHLVLAGIALVPTKSSVGTED